MNERRHRSLTRHQLIRDLNRVKKEYTALRKDYFEGNCDPELAHYQLSNLEQQLDFLDVRLAMMVEAVNC